MSWQIYSWGTHWSNIKASRLTGAEVWSRQMRPVSFCDLKFKTMFFLFVCYHWVSLKWRHNGHDNVSNHQPHACLHNYIFRRRSKKTSKRRVTGLCAGNSPGTGEFPAQMASNAENISIWWRHHGDRQICASHSEKAIRRRSGLMTICQWQPKFDTAYFMGHQSWRVIYFSSLGYLAILSFRDGFLRPLQWRHMIMSAMASQITGDSIVYSTVCSGTENIKAPRH